MKSKGEFILFLGTYLKSHRLEKGLTQIDFTSLIDVSSENISAIERGEVSLALYWINRFCLKLEPTTFNSKLYYSKKIMLS